MFKVVRAILANRQALEAIGLVGHYRVVRGLPEVSWEHYEPGDRVQLIASGRPVSWRYVAKEGDTGSVELLIQGEGPVGYQDQDLYRVRLDHPKVSGQVVYALFKELKPLGEKDEYVPRLRIKSGSAGSGGGDR